MTLKRYNVSFLRNVTDDVGHLGVAISSPSLGDAKWLNGPRIKVARFWPV